MTLTFAQAAEQLGEMADRMESHVARGLSYGLEKHVREAAVVTTVKAGIGRRLWGNKRAGAFAMFKREPIRLSGGMVVTTIIVKGIAALAETGGQTLPHVIVSGGQGLAARAAKAFKKGKLEKGQALASAAARGVRLLSFTVGGRRMAAPLVHHPGSRINRTGAMAAALDAAGEKVSAEIAKHLDAFIADVQKG